MTLLRRLQAAFDQARADTAGLAQDRCGNQMRSSTWVEQMAEQFREVYRAPGQTVFSRRFAENPGYCVNELLFDVLVCDTIAVNSPVHKVALPAITRAIWVVESEFSDNARDVVFDFGKLAIARAPYKLMVIADSNHMLQPLAACVAAATDPAENYYLASLPHPNDWGRPGAASLRLWRRGGNGAWVSCEGPTLAADGSHEAAVI